MAQALVPEYKHVGDTFNSGKSWPSTLNQQTLPIMHAGHVANRPRVVPYAYI